jgi:RNA polymerase sigma factor (sigma-70 family)
MNLSSSNYELQRVIAGFLAGDSRQYQIIRGKVRQYIQRQYSGDAADKDDLEAEILQILFEALKAKRFNGNNLKSFSSFVYGIARIHVLEAVRKKQAAPERLANPDLVQDRATHDLGQAAENSDLAEKIYAALGGVCARLLRLKFQRGWSDQEIAEHEGKTKNAVSTAISRCVRKAQELDIIKDILYKFLDSEHLDK